MYIYTTAANETSKYLYHHIRIDTTFKHAMCTYYIIKYNYMNRKFLYSTFFHLIMLREYTLVSCHENKSKLIITSFQKYNL